jgi:hypothetical protein
MSAHDWRVNWINTVEFLIEHFLTWPAVALIVMLLFRKPLTGLLSRLQILKAGREGFSLDANPPATELQAQSSSPDAGKDLQQAMDITVPASVREREEAIRVVLRNLTGPESQKINVLVRNLAVYQAMYCAEMIYRTIFGSQIALLRQLNLTSAKTPADVKSYYYEIAKAQFPALYADYSFEQWVGYLTSWKLIAVTDGGRFSITEGGREFLKWMTDARATEDKAF